MDPVIAEAVRVLAEMQKTAGASSLMVMVLEKDAGKLVDLWRAVTRRPTTFGEMTGKGIHATMLPPPPSLGHRSVESVASKIRALGKPPTKAKEVVEEGIRPGDLTEWTTKRRYSSPPKPGEGSELVDEIDRILAGDPMAGGMQNYL